MKKILLFIFLLLSNFIFGQTCSTPNVILFGTTSITSTSAKPYWTAVSGAISYKVQYRIRNIGASYSTSFTTTTNSITLNNLQPLTKYEFIVQTVCGNGGNSSFSPSGWFTTLVGTSSCGIPNINLFGTTSITSTSAKPYWTAVSGAISYNVQYRVRNVGASYSTSFNTTTNSITLSNLSPSTKYEFIVQTMCNTGNSIFSSSGWFTTIQGTTGCIPPTTLSTSNVTNTSAILNWSSVSGTLYYTLQYRKVGISNWTTISSLTTTSYLLVGLTINSNYEFQVNTVCSTGTSQYSNISNFTTTGGISGVPQFNHIVVVIGENMMPSSLYGNTTSAPYINNLISNGAYFSQSYALSHPSQPNYLQLFSGGNQGVIDDNKPSSHFTTPNLARELVNVSKTFTNYSESMPSVGYDGNTSGLYVRKHNAVANWMGTGVNQVSTILNQPFTSFPTNYNNLPNVSFVIPDLCGDGHDVCSPYNDRTKQYDTWVQTYLDGYKQYCSVPSNNSLLIVTFDEDDFTSVNRILTVFYGSHVAIGTYNQTINHYDILRMLEDANGLTTHAGSSSSSPSITFCWSSLLRSNINEYNPQDKSLIYPNPITNDFNIEIKDKKEKIVGVQIYSIMGEIILNNSFISEDSYFKLTYNKDDLKMSNGIYIIKITYDDIEYVNKVIVN